MRTQVLVLTNKDRKWFPSGPTRSRWGQKRRPWGKPRRSLEQTLTTRDGPLGRLLEVRTVPQALWGVTTIAPAPINTFPPDHLTSIRFRCCSQLKLWSGRSLCPLLLAFCNYVSPPWDFLFFHDYSIKQVIKLIAEDNCYLLSAST